MENKIKDILIELKESDKFECKLAKNSFPKEALNTYSAFANTDGGILFLGVPSGKRGITTLRIFLTIYDPFIFNA